MSTKSTTPPPTKGLSITRTFTQDGQSPFDTVVWERRDAAIKNHTGKAIFEQKNVEFPTSWSVLATNVVASKYFYGDLSRNGDDPAEGGRESSLRQLIHRVTRTITDAGKEAGYFATPEDAERFYDELTWLCVHQYGAFNSPVWFNVGLHHLYGVRDTGGKTIFGWQRDTDTIARVDPYKRPQGSACFIISVDDSIDDIWQLMAESARLFKYGSGVGADWSKLRSSSEKLSGGGQPSGPVSFMRVQDSTGGTIKSGGKTRRAAIMQTLKVWHPDVMEFITAKQEEEKKAWALIEQGYDGSFNGPAYGSVAFQNVNQSVRLDDAFFHALEEGTPYGLRTVTDGRVIEEVDPNYILEKISEGTHVCGDPGVQYEDTIQKWHTVPNSGPINSSNPCVTGDTLVATADGYRRIDAMLGETPRVIGLDGKLHPTTRVIETGVKPVYRLRTKSGYEIKLTADHVVWTENRGDVPACELTKDDVVRLVPGLFGSRSIDADQALLLGLMTGDGCISGDVSTLTMNKASEHLVLEKAAEIVNAFGRAKGAAQVLVTERGTAGAVATGMASVREFLSEWAVMDEGSDQKRLRDAGMQLDRAATAAFLRGLFTTDGTVVDSGEKSQYVGLDSTSEALLQQVQLLLLNFGIKSKVYRNRRLVLRALLPDGNGGLKDYPVKQMHSLRITRSSRFVFEEAIGFMPESPKAAQLRALNSRVSGYSDKLADYVASMELLGEEPVYDLTEPRTHHFAGNGIAVHNCSEYMHLDNSACNLASLNLLKFKDADGTFNVERYRAATRIYITAMEILVDLAGYPSEVIARNSHDYRPLGLGFANLGALLMSMGVAYDSDAGRSVAGALMAIEHCEAYARSAEMAANAKLGPFPGFAKNREPMLNVIRMHRDAVQEIHPACPAYLRDAAQESADRMLALGEQYGFRNAQATVLAPTGCLVGGSLVSTNRGLVRLSTLGNPHGDQWQNTNFKVFTDEGVQQASKFYVNGVAETRKVRTRSGYTIQGTHQHRIKVVDVNTSAWEWKRFSDIREGDIVPMALNTVIGSPNTVPLPPLGDLYWTADFNTRVPRELNADLAELVGYYMGDGSLHAKGLRFCVAKGDDDVVHRIVGLVEHLFGLTAHTSLREGYTEVAVHSVPLTIWWEACGFAKITPEGHSGKGYTPYIPDAILYSNDAVVYGAFLRGLFEADGTLIEGVPALCTASESFADEVRSLLLAIGIPVSTKSGLSGLGGVNYVLRLKNRAYNLQFEQKIGFISARKLEGLSLPETVVSAKQDRIYLDREIVDQLVPAGNRHRDAVLLSMRRFHAIPRQRVEELYAETGDERLVQYLNYYYDVVSANEDGGEQFTYDISVPSNVTYVANGFISHNTIAFMMDCDTTGIEPDIALVKYKLLAGKGEGMLKIVNQTVPEALTKLGYSDAERDAILAYIDEKDTIEGAPGLKPEHLTVFDCAFKPFNGQRAIHYSGHVRMMAACQPFISGAISKTVNLPESATIEDIAHTYVEGWKLGLKAVAIYRENSKRSQPLATKKGGNTQNKKEATAGDGMAAEALPTLEVTREVEKIVEKIVYKPNRTRLPDERPSLTHKFSIAGHEGYLTVGLYPETNMPGEIFVTMAKQGSTISGLMDAFATSISIALQYGVPLEDLVNKFSHMRFEPSGFTNNRQIPVAKSLMDYIFRYLGVKFLGHAHAQTPVSENPTEAVSEPVDRSGPAEQIVSQTSALLSLFSQPVNLTERMSGEMEEVTVPEAPHATFQNQEDSPPCYVCGTITIRAGACYSCPSCGASNGCG